MGHDRLVAMAASAGARVTVYPVNFGEVFPATGGLPLPKRAPERQAYRMMELKRWREELDISLNLTPAHFPANDQLATRSVIALRGMEPASAEDVEQDRAIKLSGLILAAVWSKDLDIGDESVLSGLIEQTGADAGQVLEHAKTPETAERYAADTADAIKRGIFGAPTYAFSDEIFWGQDRLAFVAKKING